MSTYTHTDTDGDEMTITAYDTEAVIGVSEGDQYASILVSKADAPRVALELLKATGCKANDRHSTDDFTANVGMAVFRLERAIKHQEAAAEAARRAEAEAADKARLDREAEKLWEVFWPGNGNWSLLGEETKDRYRRIALAARELHKDGTK